VEDRILDGTYQHSGPAAAWTPLVLVAGLFPAIAGPSGPPEILPASAILDAASIDPAGGIPAGGRVVERGRNLVIESRGRSDVEARAVPLPVVLAGISVSVGGQVAGIVRLRPGADFDAAYDEILAIAPARPQGTKSVIVTTLGGGTPARRLSRQRKQHRYAS